jgi:hypothetical protein
MAMFRTPATTLLVFTAAFLLVGRASAQTRNPVRGEPITCSPAPCVLPPTQASEGGALVNTSPIVGNPLNPKQLLLGSNDWNCPAPPALGFFLSSDGGSNWSRICMAAVLTRLYVFLPTIEPVVGYDRSGTAYIAGLYFDNEGAGIGFVGLEKSSDGIHWSAPAVALGIENTFADTPWLVVDTNLGSPYLDSIYVSAVMIGPPGVQSENQVVVSHSNDGGTTWDKVPVAPVQRAPAGDRYTNMTVGKDGAVYLTWMYCDSGPFYFCTNNKGNMVFSKSSDGGNTWSAPTLMNTIVLGPGLPNSHVGVTDYPVIGVDNSSGPYAGNLYVVMYTWTGTYMQVQVIRSTDKGITWSKPVPVAPASVTHDQFFPWLSVSSTGLVGVSWLDRRNDPANIDYQAFAAISTDGGQSFQPNVQLTTAFSNPNVNGYPNNEWMGDYTGNTWVGPDFIAAWMDSSNGVDMQDVVGGIRLH